MERGEQRDKLHIQIDFIIENIERSKDNNNYYIHLCDTDIEGR